jgi:uroporphyrinogen-III synthase
MPKQIYLFSISSHPSAISINSLDIKLLKPSIDFSKYDYLVITSKQASKALSKYDKKEYINKPALCVSTQSAKSYIELGGSVLDTGSGYGDNLVDKITSYSKDTKWLYLRAKVVASNFVEICRKDGYSIDEVIVYESSCSQDIKNAAVKDDGILIFTSPSSVDCYLKNHDIMSSNIVIVIGKTTAKALPKNIKYILSKKTTIESCIEIAKSF